MANQDVIEIKITGENVTPEKVSSRDIGELIASVEAMIAAIVARDNPALGIDESEVIVGLASIEHGSYALLFQSQYEAEAIDAHTKITNSINTGNYSNIPIKSIDAIKSVRKVARKYSTEIEFWRRNGRRDQLATVNTNTRIEAETSTITSKTTLYGFLIGVGGVEPPRARIRLFNGNIFNCHITRRGRYQIARQLGERLYTEVGVYGVARWDVRDMSLDHFLIERLTEYSKKPIDQALESLYSVAGKHYEAVEGIESLIAEIRGTDGDE
jgi:hypothetical protein